MNLPRLLAESPPRVRWQVGRAWTALVLRRAFAHLGAGSVIVSPHVLRGVDRISIGSDCAIYDGVWLQCEPDRGRIDIGDRVYLGHGVHIHSVDPVAIGRGCVLADGVLVNSGDHPPGDRHAVKPTGAIVIGDDVFVGQRAMVLGGVTIGDGATVGANAVVTRDVAPGAVVGGVPARPLGETTP
jgi:acetyltransferase-like isoleucine patch superfamily enzyme